MIVVADCKLGESRCSTEIINSRYLGNNKPCSSDSTFLVIIHHFLCRATVKLTETKHHRGHNNTVFNLNRTDIHRGE